MQVKFHLLQRRRAPRGILTNTVSDLCETTAGPGTASYWISIGRTQTRGKTRVVIEFLDDQGSQVSVASRRPPIGIVLGQVTQLQQSRESFPQPFHVSAYNL